MNNLSQMANHAKWSEELTIQMIMEYEKREYLWNPVSQYYKNKRMREEGYMEMLSVLRLEDVTVKELKNKIKNIRSSYSVELKKIRAARKSAYAYKPSVTWFEHADKFLRAIVTPCSVDNTLLDTNLSDDSHTEGIDNDYIFEEDPSPPKLPPKKPQKRRNSSHPPFVLNTPSPRSNTPFGVSHSPFAVFTPSSTPFGILPTSSCASTPFLTPPVGIATPLTGAATLADIYAVPPRRRKRATEIESSFSGENISNDNASEDEFEMFAKLIANQLRKLPLSLALDTQLKIQTLVNAARIQAVYQQYSYPGPSQETLSVTALSNNILSNIISRHAMPRQYAERNIREQSVDIKSEMEDSEIEDQNDFKD